jgi:hypothetical protein
MPQGMILTGDQASKQLYENNRDFYNRKTWENLLNTNAVAALKAENQIVKDYTDTSAEAYISYLKNKNTIQNSGIVGSGRDELLKQNQLALEEAYNSYRQNLNENISAIQEAKVNTDESIYNTLSKEGEMTAEYNNLHYDYLTKLYEQYQAGENTLFNELNWQKFLTRDLNTELTDEQIAEYNNLIASGTELTPEQEALYLQDYRLKTREELSTAAWDELTDENGNVIGRDYTSLYDENGNLTVAGADFFDQLENAVANTGGYSWGDFLSENNQDVYDWAMSYNPYNYTDDGTNAGTYRTMTGRMSTDYAYSFAERFGGLSEKQINGIFADYTKAAEDLADKIANTDVGGKGKGYQEEVRAMVGEIQDLAKELGIDKDLEQEMGMTWDDVINQIDTNIQNSRNNGEMTGDWFSTFFGQGTASSATGAAIAYGSSAATTAIGSTLLGASTAIPVVGQAIGVTIIIAGALYAMHNASKGVAEQRRLNEELTKQTQQIYNNLLTGMVDYSLTKKRQAAIENHSIKY